LVAAGEAARLLPAPLGLQVLGAPAVLGRELAGHARVGALGQTGGAAHDREGGVVGEADQVAVLVDDGAALLHPAALVQCLADVRVGSRAVAVGADVGAAVYVGVGESAPKGKIGRAHV